MITTRTTSTATNQARSGISFQNLEPGPHTLLLKYGMFYNNSSTASTDFVVSESAKLALDHVLNYPNPFTTHTTFMFEHNGPIPHLMFRCRFLPLAEN